MERPLGGAPDKPAGRTADMIRKYLFFGLMIMLVTVVAWLFIQTRRQEKQLAAEAAEVVRSAKATPTRVLAPRDIQILESSMEETAQAQGGSAGSTTGVRHRITLRNTGKVTYGGILLTFTYTAPSGNEIYTKNYLVTGHRIQPGATESLDDILIPGIPREASGFTVRVAYAEIDRPPAGEEKDSKQ
jgi:hypothetical protein